jgi:tight adherence protein B
VISLVIAIIGAYGVYLIYTSAVLGWRGCAVGPASGGSPKVARRRMFEQWLSQAGLGDIRPRDFVAVSVGLAILAGLATFALFGGGLPAVAAGLFAGAAPLAAYRSRRDQRRSDAREAWPRMIEEIRLHTGAIGRAIPQALFEVGRHGPPELRGAFATAEREWLLSTDFTRTVRVLKTRLGDATADAALETLLVAHEVGGSGLDRRLGALIDDRIQDVQGRKDARARQAGVRFARRFVLIVPLGMAVAGLSIGSGRTAYQTGSGQVLVAIGIGVVVACWGWAGRYLKLPEEERVFLGERT